VAGDMLLVEVALRRALREQDVVARLGADEFAVALFDIDKDYQPGFVAQKLLAVFDDPFFIDGHELRVGASIGVSMYPEDASDTETLLRLADIAMYRAKQGGDNNENGYVYYSEEMNRNTLDLLRIETGLLHAFEYNELLLYYQPKVDMNTLAITGAEALVRWQHPELLPGEFIPIAEETGLIVQLSDWVLDAVCRQARSWKEAGLAPIRIALNVTAREFTRSLPDRVRAALSRHMLSGDWLELEITEHADAQHRSRHFHHGKDLQPGHHHFAGRLRHRLFQPVLPEALPHQYAQDRPLLHHGHPDDTNDCAIASAIIGIAKQLRHKVIAEGVETEKQFNFLREAGCNELQGYIFSRPIPAPCCWRGASSRWRRLVPAVSLHAGGHRRRPLHAVPARSSRFAVQVVARLCWRSALSFRFFRDLSNFVQFGGRICHPSGGMWAPILHHFHLGRKQS
jgi:predicted signal transduction protein with EAL and GGDEF domain